MQEKREKDTRKNNDFLYTYGKYSSLAIQTIVLIAGFVWGGVKLDQWLGLKPLFTLLLSLSGVGGAIYLLVRDIFRNKPKR